MFVRFALAVLLLVIAAFGAEQAGTWKLNTSKSKFAGMPAPKQMTVVYTPEGSGWRYEGSGMTADGQPIKSSFRYVKDGEEIRTTGFPNWDSIVITDAKSDRSTAVFKRAGKVVGKGTRAISADGKTMTIEGKITMPDGKDGSFTSVYDRQ